MLYALVFEQVPANSHLLACASKRIDGTGPG